MKYFIALLWIVGVLFTIHRISLIIRTHIIRREIAKEFIMTEPTPYGPH